MNNSLEKISKKIAQTSLFMAGLGLVAIAPIAAQDDQNIVELAQSDDNLSTLVTAVDTAGLVDTLSVEILVLQYLLQQMMRSIISQTEY